MQRAYPDESDDLAMQPSFNDSAFGESREAQDAWGQQKGYRDVAKHISNSPPRFGTPIFAEPLSSEPAQLPGPIPGQWPSPLALVETLPRAPRRSNSMPVRSRSEGSGLASMTALVPTTRKQVNSPRKVGSTKKSPSDIVIAVFGLTGTGKSSFISKLTGKDVKIGHDLGSCTVDIDEVTCQIGQHTITLVDTPGFDDTFRTDTDILRLIAAWMKAAYDEKMNFKGIIYLHRISDIRMGSSSMKNLRMFRSLCGMDKLSNVILTTTMWGNVSLEDGERREAELCSEGQYWATLKAAGAMVRRYHNTRESAIALIEELLQKKSVHFQIQQEIAVQKKDLVHTEAGKSINEALKELSEKHAKDLQEVREEITEAMKNNDEALRKELEAAQRRLKEQLAANEEDKAALQAPMNKKGWFYWRCKGKKCKRKLLMKGPDGVAPCPYCAKLQYFQR